MKTVVGDNCLIMAYCHIAMTVKLVRIVFSNNSTLAGHIWLRLRSFMTAVHQFVYSNHAFVTGGSLVGKMFHHMLKLLVSHYLMWVLILLAYDVGDIPPKKLEKYKVYIDYFIKKITIILKLQPLLKLKWKPLRNVMKFYNLSRILIAVS